jgi:acetyl-CoA acyltransferase
MDVVDLAILAAREVVARAALDPATLALSLFGTVAPAPKAPNLGREVVLACSWPASISGHTVNMACVSSLEALATGARGLLLGEGTAALVGGAESLSNIPVTLSRRAAQSLQELGRAKSVKAKLAILSRLRLKDLAPVPPSIAEYSTGQSMGQACEKMARENEISRRAQDEIALLSQQRAWTATEEGYLAPQLAEVIPPPDYKALIDRDGTLRPTTSAADLAALKPVFDREYGTLTAGNSSPLADGAVALLLMTEERALAEGYAPLGYLRSWATFAVAPGEQLLQAPAYAIPLALDRAGMSLADVNLFEMHEAFGAQLLSNLKALASANFGRRELGRAGAVGEVDLDRLNVGGGSIAFGHPFGATGGRLVLQLLYELRRRGLGVGLAVSCAAGGLGSALVVERS